MVELSEDSFFLGIIFLYNIAVLDPCSMC